MGAHARKIQRILAVQQQLHRIDQWRLADLQRRQEELVTSEKALVAALNGDDALQGLFIDCLARRLRSLADEASRVDRERDAQLVRLLEQAGRMICAERLAQAVELNDLRSNEKKELLDVIERCADPAQASRKIAG